MQDHPLWELEVELERGMLRAGADRVRSMETSARTRGEMTRLAPVRGLLQDWLPQVAEGLTEWCRVMERARGVKPIALPYVRDCDPYVASLIALRAVLDGLSVARQGIATLALDIGRQVEHEQQVRLWEREAPDLFRTVEKHLDRDGATQGHRRRVHINRFNALMAAGKFGFEWVKWPQEVQFRVGVVLLDTIVRVTQWFELSGDPNHVFRRGKPTTPKLVLTAKEGLTQWLGDQMAHLEVTTPEYRPTVIPPRPWTDTRSGGYWTPYVRTPRLIRFKANQEEQRDRAADEYEALDMPLVYEAINFLQEVPYRVNTRVLAVVREAWERDLGPDAHLPLRTEPPMPERTAAVEAGEEEAVRDWKRAAARVFKRRAKQASHVRAADRTLKLATEYAGMAGGNMGAASFYFPHMLDFRGRMYPIPAGLQPQGDDLARGLLEYAEGKPVDGSGGFWLGVQLASAWGMDKVSFEERLAWVKEREAMWDRIARDPLGSREWLASPKDGGPDKPWQALAAVFDWVGFLDQGEGYVSHAICSVDGTCNGLQHLSAMTLDEAAGTHVNLVPGAQPRDIYKHVAGILQRKLEAIEAAGGQPGTYASYWLDLCGRNLPRSLTKRQVMVMPYGGTKDSFFTYTRVWLDEADPLPDETTMRRMGEEQRKALFAERNARLSLLVQHLWDTVRDAVPGAVQIMKWLQDCAKHATVANQPIFWTTPSGFVVRHFYGQQVDKQIWLRLDGSKCRVEMRSTTKDLDVKSQLRGIAPNFTHSLDAAALVLSVLSAKEDGITAFTAVHDAYGTHAADMWKLFGHLRAAFVEVHSADVLKGFRDACKEVLAGVLRAEGLEADEAETVAEDRLEPVPVKGALELAQVLESDYFFA